jgi:hypothetical protein
VSLKSDQENELSDLMSSFRTRIIQVQNNATRFAASTAGKIIKKANFEIYVADVKVIVPVHGHSFFCSTVLTPQHYH